MGDYRRMYTIELKTEIKSNLLRKDQLSTNPWIYRREYIEKKELSGLIKQIENITKFITSNRLDERIFCILNDIDNVPKCYCGKEVKFKRFQLGYANYCSVKCRANDLNWVEKVKIINTQKYGVPFIAQQEHERLKRQRLMKQTRQRMDMSLAPTRRKETIQRLYGEHYNSGWTEQAIQTRINNGTMVPVEILDEYKEYYRKVIRITEKQNLSSLSNIEKRGVMGLSEDPHHVDHIVSIYDAFMNDVPPEITGHISNLQCLPAKVNISKGNLSWLTVEQLYERYKQWER